MHRGRRRRNKGGGAQCLILMIIYLAFMIHQWYLMYTTFPDQLRHIEPTDWKSHDAADLDKHIRALADITPRILNDTMISVCEDIEVDSKKNIYCINQDNNIVKYNTKKSVSERLHIYNRGKSYGLKLSTDEKLLYFTNSIMGLCEFDIKKKTVTPLINYYNGEFLKSLNGVEVHPKNPDLIYVSQSSEFVDLERFNIDIFLGNPFGRVFEYNKKTERLSLLADELHYPNGMVFHRHKNQDTLLVAQTSRFRVSRIYISEARRGIKQVAIDKLNVYADNMKLNEKGQLLIGAMGIKSLSMFGLEETYFMRIYNSRYLTEDYSDCVGTSFFGGLRITLSKKGKKPKVEYLLWNQYQNYDIASTLLEKDNTLYMSSFEDQGVIVVENFNEKIRSTKKNKRNDKNRKYALLGNATGYYSGQNNTLKIELAWNYLKGWFSF